MAAAGGSLVCCGGEEEVWGLMRSQKEQLQEEARGRG